MKPTAVTSCSLELAVGELAGSLLGGVLVLVLPVVDHLRAAIEQQHLLPLADPRLALQGRLQLLPGVLAGPEEELGHGAAVAPAEHLVHGHGDVLVQPQEIQGVGGLLRLHRLGSLQPGQALSGVVDGGIGSILLDLSLLGL